MMKKNLLDFKGLNQQDIIKLAMTVFLCIVFLAVSVRAVQKIALGKKQQGAGVVAVAMAGVDKHSTPVQTLFDSLDEESKTLDLKRDPFTGVLYVTGAKVFNEFFLNGILLGAHDSLAIINGNIAKKGDKVGAKTVVDIKEDRVILTDGATMTELLLQH